MAITKEVENKFKTLQGRKLKEVSERMSQKQDFMMSAGMISKADLKKLGPAQLMSAELVIADLLREIDDLNAGRAVARRK
jgi:hypothetical protein